MINRWRARNTTATDEPRAKPYCKQNNARLPRGHKDNSDAAGPQRHSRMRNALSTGLTPKCQRARI
eukprot:7745427-Lingulodinium_polyedra.AAC.1